MRDINRDFISLRADASCCRHHTRVAYTAMRGNAKGFRARTDGRTHTGVRPFCAGTVSAAPATCRDIGTCDRNG